MLIKVKVSPCARAERIVKKADDFYVMSVCESAQNGEANYRIVQILKTIYPRGFIKIISGHRKSAKIIEIIKR